MNNKQKIVFVLPSLVAGGAERVMSFVATNIDKSKFDVSILVAGFENDTKYPVKNTKVIYLNKSRVLHAIPNFYKSLKKINPDIVISSIAHVNITMVFLSFFFTNTKFIGREANVLSIKKKFTKGKSLIGKLSLIQLSYRFLDVILCQSKDMYNDLYLNYKISKSKMRIINNPITDDFILKDNLKQNDKVTQFITVANLKAQKGHLRIINSISKLNTPFHYTIVGDGSEKRAIFELIEKLNLKDKITHIPYTDKVSEFLAKSDFFLQGSYVEGFPNCLIESCSVGTPIIAFNAPGGLNEIIDEGINGYISQDNNEFINNILKAIEQKDWDPKKVRQSVYSNFNKEKIISQYEQLFTDILN